MTIIDFLKKGGKTKSADLITGIQKILGIESEEEMAKIWQIGLEKYGSDEGIADAINAATEGLTPESSADEVRAAVASVFSPDDQSQMFKCGGKLQQLTSRFAKGGTMECGCGSKVEKAQDGTLIPRSKAIANDFFNTYRNQPEIEELTIPPVLNPASRWVTRREAAQIASDLENLDRKTFGQQYRTAKRMLRKDGLWGDRLRQDARRMVSGIDDWSNGPVSTSIKVAPVITTSVKPMGLDLRGHDIGVVNDAAINNALADAVMAGKSGSGASRRKALGDRADAVQSIVNNRTNQESRRNAAEEEKQRRIQEVEDRRSLTDNINKILRQTDIIRAISAVRDAVEGTRVGMTPAQGLPNTSPNNQGYYNRENDTWTIARSIPAATFNPRYASGNWIMVGNKVSPYSESYASRNVINGTAARTLQSGGEVNNQDWLSIWQNQKVAPIENDSDTAQSSRFVEKRTMLKGPSIGQTALGVRRPWLSQTISVNPINGQNDTVYFGKNVNAFGSNLPINISEKETKVLPQSVKNKLAKIIESDYTNYNTTNGSYPYGVYEKTIDVKYKFGGKVKKAENGTIAKSLKCGGKSKKK